MSMQCKANNILTSPEVRSMTPEEDDMEVMEDMKVEEDIEVEEGVEEHSVMVEDRSSAITVANKVTMHEIVRQLPVPIVKPSITLLKSSWYC